MFPAMEWHTLDRCGAVQKFLPAGSLWHATASGRAHPALRFRNDDRKNSCRRILPQAMRPWGCQIDSFFGRRFWHRPMRVSSPRPRRRGGFPCPQKAAQIAVLADAWSSKKPVPVSRDFFDARSSLCLCFCLSRISTHRQTVLADNALSCSSLLGQKLSKQPLAALSGIIQHSLYFGKSR